MTVDVRNVHITGQYGHFVGTLPIRRLCVCSQKSQILWKSGSVRLISVHEVIYKCIVCG